MTAALVGLLDRVRAATGPDRELDADIWQILVPGVTRKKSSYVHKASGRLNEIDETRDANHRLIIVPSYTSFIDAAIALVERCLPGAFVEMGTTNYAAIRVDDWDMGDAWNMASLPLAILSALLQALVAKEAKP